MTTQHRKPDPTDRKTADDRVYLYEHSIVEPMSRAIEDFGDETQRNQAITTEEGMQQDHFLDTDDEQPV